MWAPRASPTLAAVPTPSDPDALWAAAKTGDRRAAARVISVVEDERAGHDQLLAAAFRAGGRAYTVGVTGPPGSGKSTLTDALITRYRKSSAQVGVVAVDPSSPFTGGAILGDRIRMQDHASDAGVFVRSMSSRGHLGGLANATAKVVTVLDALGFDPIIAETVGVGQSEVEVMELSDTVVLVMTPGMGDGIQTAKAGLLEVGDVLVVNKADMPGADEVVRDLTLMLDMAPHRTWQPPIVSTVAKTGKGTEELAGAIAAHRRHLEQDGRLEKRRAARLESMVRRAVISSLSDRLKIRGMPDGVVERVLSRELDPWSAARQVRA